MKREHIKKGGEKFCLKCNSKMVWTPRSVKNNETGYGQFVCRPCRAERERVWRRNNRPYLREYFKKLYKNNALKYRLKNENNRLRREYGITTAIRDAMFVAQNWKCPICSRTLEKKHNMFAVDHDHRSGKVRAILCGDCNKGIGMLKDSIFILKNAVIYLEKHETTI